MEKRRFLRVPIDAPHFVNLHFGGDKVLTALLIDFSRGGVQVVLPPFENEENKNLLGENVVVKALPGAGGLPAYGEDGVAGTVLWISLERCGINFDQLLDIEEEELLTFLHGLGY